MPEKAQELALADDFLRITGRTDPLRFASWLTDLEPDRYAWEAGRPTQRYAASLVASGGIVLAYARRNRAGLDAPQSDARDSDDFVLEVPGASARDLLAKLRTHPDARTMQAPRRDICATFRAEHPGQVYSLVRELIAADFHRPAHRIGPDGSEWQGVTIQTHEKQADAPRFLILYDKHAQDSESYPDPGTVRLEFRFQPEKKPQKVALFWESAERVLDAWRFARRLLEVVTLAPRHLSFAWLEPTPAGDLARMTRNLLASYGPTIFRGIASHGADYLQQIALAAMLQAAEPVTASQGSGARVAPQDGPREARVVT